jgi:hypothetical protein
VINSYCICCHIAGHGKVAGHWLQLGLIRLPLCSAHLVAAKSGAADFIRRYGYADSLLKRANELNGVSNEA